MIPLQPLDPAQVRERVRAALEEDAAHADRTVSFLGLDDHAAAAEVRVAGETVACGLELAREAFRQIDRRCAFSATGADGERVAAGDVLCRITGPARSIVSAERTALNFLQRMSGVATHAARFVAAVEGTGVVILDTRKTTPGWRDLDKYAVRCGGARNHRRDLGAMVLIKENHIRALGGRAALLDALSTPHDDVFVEVEVDSLEFLEAVLDRRVERIMLDNFTPAEVSLALDRVGAFRRAHPQARLEIEVSGGITLENVRAYAQAGVDFISVGALTHSAPAAAMSLEML